MSTVKDLMNSLGPEEKFISFEFFPPKTDSGFRNLLARLNRLSAFNPLFITVTWGAGGSTSEKSLDLASTCQKKIGINTVLHLTCTNTNKEVIDEALKRAKINGIRNILALRGDPARTEEYWTPNCEFKNAIDLVKYIRKEYGNYFCIGVAAYPEGHVDGSDNSNQNPKKDIPFLIEKIKAGADFIITQLFFDVDKFINFEKLIKQQPELKDIPLIPGLMPITTHKVFTRATKLSHATIPNDIYEQFEKIKNDDDAVKSLGVELICEIIDKINKLTNLKGYHFYTLNLEKAVASIVNESKVLHPILDGPSTRFENEDVLATDSEDEDEVDIPISNGNGSKKSRRKSSINENVVGKNVNSKLLYSDKKALYEISRGKGALGKDATWDDFPNGRFGDSNSPAYGEIDGYGPNLKIHNSNEAIIKWGSPTSISDISLIFKNYLSGKIDVIPWADSSLSPETTIIQEQLFELNDKGWFSIASQPAVNGCKSTDNIFGWGPSNGIIYQKSFIELFLPKTEWEHLQKRLDDNLITYYSGNYKNEIKSNLKINENHNFKSKNAVTWGVFPSKEVIQPTVIDYESFKAWNEEAFLLWLEWSRCYKKQSKSFKLLNYIYENYILISLIHHEFPDENALWDLLLE
ncbi:MET12 [Candida pseudojiufengensis]|uniref:MET12 n=1 Tax=Candida pseudojiufengensis TaxID=497109 RepID=UPI002224F6CF|nr:MET12 [Candida pseudojiufengensis]KAI5965161.1 MET12 [Candida pseudojiufengensis]